MWQEVASSPAFHAAFPWLILVLGAAGYAVVFALLRETAGPGVRPARSPPPAPPPPPPQAAVRVGRLSRTLAYAVEADAEGARLERAQLILTLQPSPAGAGAEPPGALRARLFGHVPQDEGFETPPLDPLAPAAHVAVQVRRLERLDLVALAMATVDEVVSSRLGGRYVALTFAEPDARDLCAALGLDPATTLARLPPVA